jgi:hypothetical protein
MKSNNHVEWLLKTLWVIFLLVVSVPDRAYAGPLASSTPQAITTEYFRTLGAGFILRPDLTTPSKSSYSYFLNYKLVKPFVNKVWAEIEFQNPEVGNRPLRITRTIVSGDKQLAVRSPEVNGLKEFEIYTVVLRIYKDEGRQHLITEHVQMVQAPTVQQSQTVSALIQRAGALNKGYTRHECSGMKANLLLPPGWYFKEETTGSTVACFLSKEEIIGAQGKFSTGLSINRFKSVASANGGNIDPKGFVRRAATNIGGRYKLIRNDVSFEIEYINPETTPPIHIVVNLIANTQSGSTYMATAEAPEERWKADWPILERIIRAMQLDRRQ